MIEAVIRRPGEVEVHDLSADREMAPGEALVEVRCISLCGSDYKLFEGAYGGPCAYPICFGHEWSGTVVGASAGGRIPVGTAVTGDCSKWCGRCALCRRDRNLCRHIEKFGITTAGFSRQVRAVDERYLHPNTRGLSFPELALTEVCAVVLHGVRRAGTRARTRRVLVVGAGVLGALTGLILTRAGAVREVLFVEPDPVRRELGRRLLPGAGFIDPPTELGPGGGSYAALSRLCRADLAFECSGSPGGFDAALALTGPLGTIVCFGLGRPGVVSASLIVLKSLRLIGSIGGTGDFPRAMRFLAENRDLAGGLVTHRFRVADAQRVFEATRSDSGRLKVQMEF
jgi:threonine dehydrogenase-like Zn-dependent dehydrogenase